MKHFSPKYIKFEKKHLKELENLWYITKDEKLRQVILDAREVLEDMWNNSCMKLK